MNKKILYTLALLSITAPIQSSNFIERNASTLLCVTAVTGVALGGTLVYWYQKEVQQEERNELYEILRTNNNLQGHESLPCKSSSDTPVASDELKEAAEKVLSNFQETLNKNQTVIYATNIRVEDERRTKERLQRDVTAKNELIAKLQEEARVKTQDEKDKTIVVQSTEISELKKELELFKATSVPVKEAIERIEKALYAASNVKVNVSHQLPRELSTALQRHNASNSFGLSTY